MLKRTGYLIAVFVCFLAADKARSQAAQPAPAAGLCTYHCFCKARCGSDVVGTSITDAIIDWGAIKVYHNYCLNREKNADDCSKACSDKAINDPNWNSASFLCSKCPSGKVTAYASVATKEYKTAHTRIITNTPAVTTTTCKCPAGWLATMTNVDGGVSQHGCKRVACQPNGIAPYPPDGTPIGTWGFTWGNAILAWGTDANGGAAKCVTSITSPAVCKINL